MKEISTDDYLETQVSNHYDSDDTTIVYSLEIFNTIKTFLFKEDLSRDELQGLLDERDIEILHISTDNTSLCQRNGMMIEIVPSEVILGPEDL